MRKDWISVWWQAACLPKSIDVCGVSVPPLSVWHVFALESTHNPYLCGGRVTIDHAVALLSFAVTDRDGGRRLIWDERYRDRVQRRVLRRLLRNGFDRVHVACGEYVDISIRTASRWQRGGDKSCSVPYAWHMVSRLGDEAWNMPYAVARAKCDAMAEQNGDDTILSMKAQEMEDNWDEIMAQDESSRVN